MIEVAVLVLVVEDFPSKYWMCEIQGLGRCGVPCVAVECGPLAAMLTLLYGGDPPGGRVGSVLGSFDPLGFCWGLPPPDVGALEVFPRLLVSNLKEPSR